MAAFVRKFFAQQFRPNNFPVTPVDGEHDELMTVRYRDTVVRSGGVVINRLLGRADGDGGGEKHAVSEEDGGGMAFAGDRKFPADVVGFAPMHRRIRGGGNAVGQRSAPLGP